MEKKITQVFSLAFIFILVTFYGVNVSGEQINCGHPGQPSCFCNADSECAGRVVCDPGYWMMCMNKSCMC
ncbi:hypothetical protein LINGRAHAP2_LOCUS34012, partial [Linum grandiflorum]